MDADRADWMRKGNNAAYVKCILPLTLVTYPRYCLALPVYLALIGLDLRSNSVDASPAIGKLY